MNNSRKLSPHRLRPTGKRKRTDPDRGLKDAIPLGLHRYQLLSNGMLIFQGGNQAAEQILGIDHQSIVGKPIEAAFPKLALTEIPDAYRQVARNGGTFERELLAYEDGPVNGVFKVQAIQSRPGWVAVFFQDIREQKQALNVIRDSEQHLRALIDASPLGLHQYELQSDGRLILSGANNAAQRILGIDHQTLIGLPIEEAFPAHRKTEIPAIYRKVANEGTPYSSEQIFYQDDQIHGAFEIQAFQTGPSRMAVFFQDITSKSIAEESLRESEAKFRMLIEQNSEGVVLSDEEGRVIEWNAAQERYSGIPRLEALGHPIWELQYQVAVPEEQKSPARFEAIKEKILHHLRTGQSPIFEIPLDVSIEKPDGGVVFIQQTAFPIQTKSGFRIGSIMRDVTEQRQADIKLQRRVVELEALRIIALAGTEASSLDELVQRANAAGQGLYALGFGIGLVDETTGRVRFPSLLDANGHPALELPFGQGPTAWVKAGDGIAPEVDSPANLDPQTRSELCVPIRAGRKLIAVINVQIDNPAGFGEADERFLNGMAGELGTGLEKIRLYEKTEQQLNRLRALRRVDQSILSSLDLTVTLKVVLDMITDLLQVDAANIILYNPRKSQIRIAAACGLPEALSYQADIQVENPYARQVFVEGKTLIVPDLSQIQELVPVVYLEEIQHYSCAVIAPLIAKGEIQGILQLFQRNPMQPTEGWMAYLQTLAGQAAIAINNAQLFSEQQETNRRLVQAYDDTLNGWSRALDLRDEETEGHSQRVTDLTVKLARRIGFSEEELAHIRRGASLHDIGKMGIPDSILLKPGKLTEAEWQIMRQHPTLAANLLYPIEFLSPALEIPFGHHEKWDGMGYPLGIQGEDIPLSARIFAVIDVWDALTHDRPYRPAWSTEAALDYIREQSGKHFDPMVVHEFLELARDGFLNC